MQIEKIKKILNAAFIIEVAVIAITLICKIWVEKDWWVNNLLLSEVVAIALTLFFWLPLDKDEN